MKKKDWNELFNYYREKARDINEYICHLEPCDSVNDASFCISLILHDLRYPRHNSVFLMGHNLMLNLELAENHLKSHCSDVLESGDIEEAKKITKASDLIYRMRQELNG